MGVSGRKTYGRVAGQKGDLNTSRLETSECVNSSKKTTLLETAEWFLDYMVLTIRNLWYHILGVVNLFSMIIIIMITKMHNLTFWII